MNKPEVGTEENPLELGMVPEIHLKNSKGEVEKAVMVGHGMPYRLNDCNMLFWVPESAVETVRKALNEIIATGAILVSP